MVKNYKSTKYYKFLIAFGRKRFAENSDMLFNNNLLWHCLWCKISSASKLFKKLELPPEYKICGLKLLSNNCECPESIMWLLKAEVMWEPRFK